MSFSLPDTWFFRSFGSAAELDLEIPQTVIRNTYTLDDILPLDSQSANLIGFNTFESNFTFNGINGSGTSIVVIDSGADLDHVAFGPDLNNDGVSDRIVYSYDFSGANDSDASDFSGHGTHVAAIAAGSFNTVGLARFANLIILKVFPDGGGGANTADVNEALQWVAQNVATYNIVAVNLSIGNGSNNSGVTSSAFSSAISAVKSQGVAVVAASGNSYGNFQTPGVTVPASDAGAWAIGAVYDADYGSLSYGSAGVDFASAPDRLTAFSQRSPVLTDLLAPGAFVLSAGLNNTFNERAGTSMAAPFVTGLVAIAQDLSLEMTTRPGLTGTRLPVDTLLQIMRDGAVTVFDGDENGNGIADLPGEENDNVVNTQASYKRIDVNGTVQGVLNHWKTATAGQDALFGWRLADQINGLGGNDTIYGHDGNDVLGGGAGANSLHGENGQDVLNGEDGDDRLSGGASADTLDGGGGADTLDGGTGSDWAVYAADTLGVSVNLFSGVAAQNSGQPGATFDTLISIENLSGGAGDDFLTGDNFGNVLVGNDGADNLWGNGGADSLMGGNGDDVIVGGDDADTLESGQGQDWLYGQGGNDVLRGTDTTANAFNVLVGGDGDDTLQGSASGFDYFYGDDGVTASGNDFYVVTANSGTKVFNDFEAGGGNDVVQLIGSGFSNFAQMQANLSFSGIINGTVLTMGSGTQLWFIGLQPNALTSADFLLV